MAILSDEQQKAQGARCGCKGADDLCVCQNVPDATTMRQDRRFGYSLEADLMPVIEGKVPLPNIEDVDPLAFLNNLASGGHSWKPKWGYSSIDGQKQWTQFFLSGGQGGGLTGEGYAVRYGKSWPKPEPRVMRFAICKHEFHGTGTGEQAQRGWRPGHCTKCGLDMSVDSGD